MKNLFRILFFSIFIVTTALPQQDINQQMRTFTGRIKIYLKCLSNKCSKQEREQITASTIAKDGALILGALAAIGTGAFFGQRKWQRYKIEKEFDAVNKEIQELEKHREEMLNALQTNEAKKSYTIREVYTKAVDRDNKDLIKLRDKQAELLIKGKQENIKKIIVQALEEKRDELMEESARKKFALEKLREESPNSPEIPTITKEINNLEQNIRSVIQQIREALRQ